MSIDNVTFGRSQLFECDFNYSRSPTFGCIAWRFSVRFTTPGLADSNQFCFSSLHDWRAIVHFSGFDGTHAPYFQSYREFFWR
jgi:hypothetical protein